MYNICKQRFKIVRDGTKYRQQIIGTRGSKSTDASGTMCTRETEENETMSIFNDLWILSIQSICLDVNVSSWGVVILHRLILHPISGWSRLNTVCGSNEATATIKILARNREKEACYRKKEKDSSSIYIKCVCTGNNVVRPWAFQYHNTDINILFSNLNLHNNNNNDSMYWCTNDRMKPLLHHLYKFTSLRFYASPTSHIVQNDIGCLMSNWFAEVM